MEVTQNNQTFPKFFFHVAPKTKRTSLTLHGDFTSAGSPYAHETFAGLRRIGAIHFQDMFRLVRRIRQLGNRCLHAVGQFVLSNASGNLGVAKFLQLYLVQFSEIVEEATPGVVADPWWIRQEQHGVTD